MNWSCSYICFRSKARLIYNLGDLAMIKIESGNSFPLNQMGYFAPVAFGHGDGQTRCVFELSIGVEVVQIKRLWWHRMATVVKSSFLYFNQNTFVDKPQNRMEVFAVVHFWDQLQAPASKLN